MPKIPLIIARLLGRLSSQQPTLASPFALPVIVAVESIKPHDPSFAPNTTLMFEFSNENYEKIGVLEGGVSPLGDKFYVLWIEVLPQYRRKKYGMAMLDYLAKRYVLPIVPIHPWETALEFWHYSCGQALGVTPYLTADEFQFEKSRWVA